MESVKKSIDERAQHKREYDSWVNERQMQTIEDKVDTSKALDASLVDTENIRPIDDDEPMGEVQTTAKINVLATGQQHTEQPDFNKKDGRLTVVRQPTAFKSELPRISKPQFASQVDVNNDLSKPVSIYYLPKERESAIVNLHHVITSSESRNSSKNMPRFSSNDMVHNHYLEEAKKKTQERGRNSRPSVMSSAKS
ncbi:hypothetical protein Tco_0227021 [Tanacetum coccineum]